MSKRNIYVIDRASFEEADAAGKMDIVENTRNGLHKIGFVGLRNHGISKELKDKFYNQCFNFFTGLPLKVKQSYERPEIGRQRGYTSFGIEKAKNAEASDLKEFWQIGQDPQGNVNIAEYPENIYVKEVPGFTHDGFKLYRQFEEAGFFVLEIIEAILDLPKDYLRNWSVDGNSLLRAAFYPEITQEPESAIRAEQHEDINLITLLVGASAGGLQLLNADDEWLDITPDEDEIVINVGDMLQRLTNNYLKSTTHRVVNPPRSLWHKPRLSIPFFLHPKSEMPLDCLESCITKDSPLAYDPITAGEYLDERLEEIGLKK